MSKLSLTTAMRLCLLLSMMLMSISTYAIHPVKTKDYYNGKKVKLYPLDNGYYTIEGLSIGNQDMALERGKLYYAEYGDGSGVFLGIEVTLKDGRQDYISFAIADFWKEEKDANHKGVINFVCGDNDTYASVYAINKYCQGLIIVSSNPTILVKYSPETLVKVNPNSALEKILELGNKYKK